MITLEPSQKEYWDRFATHEEKGYATSAQKNRWVAPETLSDLAVKHFERDRPVLDIGAGTGLVGLELSQRGFVVDGVDFSEEMVRLAQIKGTYRRLICADFRQPDINELLGERYSNVIMVGVYGDCIDTSQIGLIPRVLDDCAVVAIAGDAKELGIL